MINTSLAGIGEAVVRGSSLKNWLLKEGEKKVVIGEVPSLYTNVGWLVQTMDEKKNISVIFELKVCFVNSQKLFHILVRFQFKDYLH